MKLIKQGKTKDVYSLGNGNYVLRFKNTVTGHASGEADPGGNSVVGEVEGVGAGALRVTKYFFELLADKGVVTHYVSADINKCEMTVKSVEMFGAGLEFVLRYVAAGSFVKRYGAYCKEGDKLPKIFEVTLKDDARNDPPIQKDMLAALKLMTEAQYEQTHEETVKICDIVRDDLKKKGLELYDIKLEFGVKDGKVILIDEISAGNMRVYKNGKKLSYNELSALI